MRGTFGRVLWLVLDGVADRPVASLDGQTPLEAAETPHLDRLATAGQNGTMDVARPGTPLSSDRAHTLLFGYEHGELPGRGVLEATGLDVAVPDGGVACSASFARVAPAETGWRVTDRHLRSVDADFADLATTVPTVETGGVTATFTHTWTNRGIVVLDSDAALASDITDVDPFETGRPLIAPEPMADAPAPDAAGRTATALAAFTRSSIDALSTAPVDAVLSKWAGSPCDPEPFRDRHGLTACSLTSKPVLQGLGETLDMTVRTPPETYAARPDAIESALSTFDFVHVHYPEPDEVSHSGDPQTKREEIEAIDRSLEPVVDRALTDDELVTVVTADHTTPSSDDVVHSGDPVPVTFVTNGIRTDGVDTAGERPAATGGLGRIRGRNLLRLSRAGADRVLLDGLRRDPAGRDDPTHPVSPLERHP